MSAPAASFASSLQSNAAMYAAYSCVPRAAAAANATAAAAEAASLAAAAAAGRAPAWAGGPGGAQLATTAQPATTARSEEGAVAAPPTERRGVADEVARLLQAANVSRRPPPAVAPAAQPAPGGECIPALDRFVFDACCGEGRWRMSLVHAEVDHVERQEGVNGKWAACTSVILRLAWDSSLHDETGSGQAACADGAGGEETAIELARRKAIASASQRLAKRFAANLPRAQWANCNWDQIESAARRARAEEGGADGGAPDSDTGDGDMPALDDGHEHEPVMVD